MADSVSKIEVTGELQTILAESSKLLQTLSDVSGFAAAKGVSSIDFPKMNARTAQVLAIGAAGTSSNANLGFDRLNLDKNLFDAFLIKNDVEKQNVVNVLEANMKESMRAIGLSADVEAYAALIAATEDNYVVPTTSIYEDILGLKKKFDDAKIPNDGRRYLAVNSADMLKILKADILVRYDAKGDGSAISTGSVGMVAGFRLVETTTISGDSVAYHSGCINYAFQGQLEVMSVPAPLAKSVQYSVNTNFGLKAMQPVSATETKWACRLGAAPTP